MLITDALKISMCIPFFFNAIKHDENIYVDGGLMDPLPSKYLKTFNIENNDNDDNDNGTNKNNKVLAFNINNNLLKDVIKLMILKHLQ